jgi:hypothetical protein
MASVPALVHGLTTYQYYVGILRSQWGVVLAATLKLKTHSLVIWGVCRMPNRIVKFVSTLVLAAVGMTSGASAQVATQDISITATVAKFCSIGTPAAATGTVRPVTIPITGFGSVGTAVITETFANVVCNTPATLLTTSLNGHVVNPAAAPATFTNEIDYTAVATVGGASSTINTATNAADVTNFNGSSAATPAAFSGTLSVAITPQAAGAQLVTGTYTDTLRVTLTPN